MAWLRRWHSYLSVFVAPSIIFFALTGAVQLFGLHEAHGTYQPPPLLEKLGHLHKEQTFGEERSGAGETDGDHHDHDDGHDADDEHAKGDAEHHHHEVSGEGHRATLVLKWFFLLMALTLVSTVVLGLWIALTHPARKRTNYLLLLIGAMVPLLLVLFA